MSLSCGGDRGRVRVWVRVRVRVRTARLTHHVRCLHRLFMIVLASLLMVVLLDFVVRDVYNYVHRRNSWSSDNTMVHVG